MLRGPGGWAVAVRRIDGAIAVESHPSTRRRASLWQAPFLRGLHAVAIALPLGMRSMDAADRLRRLEPRPPATLRQRAAFGASLLGAVAFAVVLFGLVPSWAGARLEQLGGIGHAGESLIRTATIVAYIASVGALADVRRVFAYHGAEHQVVAAYELGAKVDAASARNFTRFHPRCGTSFVLLVALVDGLLDAVIPLPSGVFRVLQVPIGIMLAYELLLLALRRPHARLARGVLAPGRALQRLTTRTPDHGQLEVACAALDAVLLLGPRRSEDQDEQQDDEDEYEQSATDVHAASSIGVTAKVSREARGETSGTARGSGRVEVRK
jgi:uncharacterized protein YqhQ